MYVRWSTGGHVFTLADGAISWSSKWQATISDSTTEAEYKTLSEAIKEAVYLNKLLLHQLNIVLDTTKSVPLACQDK